MNVLFVVAEMTPLVKVGGVGDVAGALPKALRRSGCDVRVALPLHAAIDRATASAKRVADLRDGAALWEGAANGVPVYPIEHETFAREKVYGYDDDVARFLAFCDGVVAAAGTIDWQPDVIHLQDWHTGLVASRLACNATHPWADVPRICTIHNLGYPGAFDETFARKHGLSPKALAVPEGLEEKLAYSGLAQGILHSDLVSTVSPTYAHEILTPEVGGELAPLLQRMAGRLSGILNGIDTELFDPATDAHLAARFDSTHAEARGENKRALQQKLELSQNEDVPLLGMVSRLSWQKGPDLVAQAVGALLDRGEAIQLAVLGVGEPEYELQLTQLAERYPQQVAVRLAFDEPLGQLIYGGCDLFLMPSRYEPCGLAQMIAMRYGAAPVVRRTGGLADSVQPCRDGTGTGFLFSDATAHSVNDAIEEALAVYRDRAAWAALQQRCMAQDFSWDRAAGEYIALYERAIELGAKSR